MEFKKIFAVLCISALALTLTACSSSSTSQTSSSNQTSKVDIKTMSGEDLTKIQSDDKEKEKYLVIDVRSEEEYKAGHLKHAVNFFVDTISDNLDKLSAWKEKPVILYCNSGKKSQVAAEKLVAAGFKDVTNAKGVKEFSYELVKYNNIMGADFQKVITEGKAFFIDVRKAADYDKGHIKDAINVQVDELDTLASKVPADKATAIYVHCYSGNRSAVVSKKLTELGYTNVTNAIDGTKEFDYKF